MDCLKPLYSAAVELLVVDDFAVEDDESVLSLAGAALVCSDACGFFPLPFPPVGDASLQYPEAYQPEPFSTKEVLEMRRCDGPPQTGQDSSFSLKSFCHCSNIC